MRITWKSVKSLRPSVPAFTPLLLCVLALGSVAAPLSAQTKVVLSQVSQLGTFPNGGVQSSGNYAGSAMVINQQGNLIAAEPNGSDVVSFNLTTGASTVLVSGFSGIGSIAIDSHNSLYVSNLYAAYSAAGNGPYQNIVKIPYVSGAYVAGAAPTGSTPACTGSDTVECYLPNLTDAADGYYIQVRTMTFDSAGDLFVGTGEGQILECTAACLTTGTPSTVVLYQEPTGTTTNGATYVTGAMAIDANGNLFFTDSNFYANSAGMYVEYSYASNLKELAYSSSKGFATTATTLYTLTPTGQGTGPESNEVTGLAIANGTVYFTTINDGVFAFTDTSGVTSPATPYAVSTQGGRAIATNGAGQFYVDNRNNTAGVDYLVQIGIGTLTVPATNVGGTPSTATNVTAILNDGACSSPETIGFTTSGTNATDFTASASSTCTASLTGTETFPVTVTFTPTGSGTETATLTATDSNSNAGTASLTGGVTGSQIAGTPTISPAGGTYTAVQTVTISSTTPSATIYYTTNGTTPTTSSTSLANGGTISVSSSETVTAIAVATGYVNSASGSASYVIPAASPTFSPGTGTYSSAQTVTLSSTTAGATIYYSTNGYPPTTGSPSVASGGTITVGVSETVMALATAPSHANSLVTSASYLINLPATTPTVVLSQISPLGTFPNGGVQSSGNYAGSAMVINQQGNLIAAEPNGQDVVSFNLTTGAETTIISGFNKIGTVAIDSNNNLYLSTLYDTGQNIVKVPYVNGAYVAAPSPSGSTPACTGSDTAECYLPNLTNGAGNSYIQVRSMTFDAAGDIFISIYDGRIIECTASCLTTNSPVPALLYREPAGANTNGDTYVTGAMVVDPNGNLFFTDSDYYANGSTNYVEYSYASNLREIAYSSGAYASSATTLYTLTPTGQGTPPESDEITGLAYANNTVYFTTINDGIFAFIDNAGVTSPSTPYAVSTQGGRALATAGTGKFYVDAQNNGTDYLLQVGIGALTLPAATVGGTPSTASNVTAILNDGSCTSPETIGFVGSGANGSDFTASAGTTCTASLTGTETFPVTVTFTPTGSGTETATLTATDSNNNSGTATVSAIAYAAPTITSISPASGPYTGGTSVTITGTNFSGVTAVKFGTVAATSFSIVSATQITAVSPAGTSGTTVDITVTNPGTTSATSAADHFTYGAASTFTSLTVTGIASSVPNSIAQTATVTALDQYGATLPGFTGTVTLTSSDALATLPAAYTFQSSDNGVHTFSVTFGTYGTQSVTATSGGVSGSETGIFVSSVIVVTGSNGAQSQFSGNFSMLSGSTGDGTTGLAIDASGDSFSLKPGTSPAYVLVEINRTGTVTSGSGYAGGGLNTSTAVAVDGNGQVWVTNGNGSLSVFSNTGTALTPATGYANAGYSTPTSLAIDLSGNVWVANSGNNTITQVIGAAAPSAPLSTAVTNVTTGVKP